MRNLGPSIKLGRVGENILQVGKVITGDPQETEIRIKRILE
jgi:hypothetical protein